MAKASLALPFAGLHGSLGNTTIVQRPDGPEVRARVYRPRKLTPGQAAGARRMRLVGEAWRRLDDATFQAWKAFAFRSAWRNPASGAIVTPQPFRLFSGLASKALQVEPGRSLAGFRPPERAFLGDGVVVEILGGAEGGSVPSLPSPEGEACAVTLSANSANSAGVVTELLAQPLANARRAVYKDKYASQGFVAFEGPETVTVPLAAGAWALGYRFVRAATGEETAIVGLGVVTVG